MTDFNEEDIKNVLDGFIKRADEELFSKTNEGLEEYWFFKWDDTKSFEWNLYQFSDLLELYKRHCRRWEENYNGSICVVERVRDEYLMPKIKEFKETLREKLK